MRASAMRARANATMRPYSFFSTSEQRIVNGKVVENKALAGEYDGEKIRIKMCENGANCKNEVFDVKKLFKTAKYKQSKHKQSKHKRQSKHKQSKRKYKRTNKK